MAAVTKCELMVKVKSTDAEEVFDGRQKIANRSATELVPAGVIDGTSLPMRLATPFRFLGFPGLPFLAFSPPPQAHAQENQFSGRARRRQDE